MEHPHAGRTVGVSVGYINSAVGADVDVARVIIRIANNYAGPQAERKRAVWVEHPHAVARGGVNAAVGADVDVTQSEEPAVGLTVLTVVHTVPVQCERERAVWVKHPYVTLMVICGGVNAAVGADGDADRGRSIPRLYTPGRTEGKRERAVGPVHPYVLVDLTRTSTISKLSTRDNDAAVGPDGDASHAVAWPVAAKHERRRAVWMEHVHNAMIGGHVNAAVGPDGDVSQGEVEPAIVHTVRAQGERERAVWVEYAYATVDVVYGHVNAAVGADGDAGRAGSTNA